jgi:mRNA-decapping enzyme subunit 2
MNFRCTNYSFPKGKVNENEEGIQCAIREVWEEIGFDI